MPHNQRASAKWVARVISAGPMGLTRAPYRRNGRPARRRVLNGRPQSSRDNPGERPAQQGQLGLALRWQTHWPIWGRCRTGRLPPCSRLWAVKCSCPAPWPARPVSQGQSRVLGAFALGGPGASRSARPRRAPRTRKRFAHPLRFRTQFLLLPRGEEEGRSEGGSHPHKQKARKQQQQHSTAQYSARPSLAPAHFVTPLLLPPPATSRLNRSAPLRLVLPPHFKTHPPPEPQPSATPRQSNLALDYPLYLPLSIIAFTLVVTSLVVDQTLSVVRHQPVLKY